MELALLLIFATFPIIGFLIYLAMKHEKEKFLEKKAQRAGWAQGHGFRALDPGRMDMSVANMLNTEVSRGVLNEFSGIRLLSRRSTSAYNVFEGVYGGDSVKLFEVRHEDHSSESTSYSYYGVTSIALRGEVPRFELRPHRTWDKVRAFFGSTDVEIGWKEVDEALHISTQDPTFLARLIDEEAAKYLIGDREDSWHCLGNRLVVIRRHHCSEADFDQMLLRCSRLAQKANTLVH